MARLAVLASCAAGAAAFTPAAPGLRSSLAVEVPVTQHAGAGSIGATTFSQGATTMALGLGAVGTVSAATAAAKSRRAPRVACAAKLITFVDGKARFAVDGAAAGGESSGVFSAKDQLGAQAPLGFWDPLNLCDGITEMEFKRLRSAEIKHGRLAMMASIGFIAPFYAKFPGYLSPSNDLKFDDIPNGLEAINSIPSGGWVQILLFAAFCEFGLNPSMEEWKKGAPGDFGYGFLGLFGPVQDPEKKKRSLSAEIANGRLAMAAITGMVIQNGITGGTGSAMWFGS